MTKHMGEGSGFLDAGWKVNGGTEGSNEVWRS